MFAGLRKRLSIDYFAVNDVIWKEDFHRITVYVFNTGLYSVTLVIGFRQSHSYIENYRDSPALVGAGHFLK
jgi:hypothetical protein